MWPQVSPRASISPATLGCASSLMRELPPMATTATGTAGSCWGLKHGLVFDMRRWLPPPDGIDLARLEGEKARRGAPELLSNFEQLDSRLGEIVRRARSAGRTGWCACQCV